MNKMINRNRLLCALVSVVLLFAILTATFSVTGRAWSGSSGAGSTTGATDTGYGEKMIVVSLGDSYSS